MTLKKFIRQISWLALAAFLSSCGHLFYYPSTQMYYDPKKLNLSPKEVEIESEDGEKIHAWLFEAAKQPAKASILFFHGNAENLTSHFVQLSWLPAEGYNYLIFDYPGYGRSSGVATAEGTVKAGRAALEWLHQYDSRPLIIYGQSLGGAIAQRVILDKKDQVPMRGVVLDSTFNSYQGIARKKLSMSFLTWIFQPLTYVLISDNWTGKKIDAISPIPVLVIHGQKDIVVEPEFGDLIFEKLKEPKTFWRIEDGSHTDVFWGHDKKYRKPFLEWLEKLPVPKS